MIGILLVTHGPMGRAMLDSAEMIVGKQKNVQAVALTPEANLDTLRQEVKLAASRVDAGQGVLVLVDLFGGTPANAVASNLPAHAYRCLCGVNLPMLLEALETRGRMALPELAAHVEEIACQSVVNLNTALERALRGDMPQVGKR
jgi:PTS system mannose-specific IIA component